MKKNGLLGAALAAGLAVSLELTGTSVHASCVTPCAVALCAGTAFGAPDEMPSIVTATHDAAVPGVLVVETVLREGSGPLLQPGDQLTATEPIEGAHLLVYASTPPAWFPIGDDGIVRCAYYDSSQLPSPRPGATAQTIASLAGTMTCTEQLSRAGYPIPPCNDTPSGSGCQIGAEPSANEPKVPGPLAIVLGGALATLVAVRLRRGRGKPAGPRACL